MIRDATLALELALAGRNNFEPETYAEVLTSFTNQSGENTRNLACNAGLVFGLPVDIAAQTVTRLCDSDLTVDAARATACGPALGDMRYCLATLYHREPIHE